MGKQVWVFKGVETEYELEWALTESEAMQKGMELAEDAKEEIEIWPKGNREQHRTFKVQI